MNSEASPEIILPHYMSYVNLASHYIYIALETMRHTPCVKQEQFDKMVAIYSDLGEFKDEIEAHEKKQWYNQR